MYAVQLATYDQTTQRHWSLSKRIMCKATNSTVELAQLTSFSCVQMEWTWSSSCWCCAECIDWQPATATATATAAGDNVDDDEDDDGIQQPAESNGLVQRRDLGQAQLMCVSDTTSSEDDHMVSFAVHSLLLILAGSAVL